jgi:hypothetical protein
MIDPLTAITTVSAGLKLVDQFRDLALRFLNQPVTPPGRIAEQSNQSIQIKNMQTGQVTEEIEAKDLHLDRWDDVRYSALNSRISINWSLFNDLFGQIPLLSGLQLAQTRQQMEIARRDLCGDFREMVGIYERALGINLPDHYKLFEVCNN